MAGLISVVVEYSEVLESNKERVKLTYEIACRVRPASPALMRDSNGTGYPGAEAEVEVTDAWCTGITRKCVTYEPTPLQRACLGKALLFRVPTIEEEIYRDAVDRAQDAISFP